MRFLVLLTEDDHFAKWEALSDEERDRCFGDYRAFSTAVRARGELLLGDALEHPDTARSVRPSTDPARRPVTDGPYAETVEQLGGFYVIDVPDLDTAVDLVKLLPREYLVEVRPTLEVEV